MKKLLALLAVVVLAVFGLAACGDDDDDGGDDTTTEVTTQETTAGGGGGGGETLDVSSPEDGSTQFDPSSLQASAGEVTITYDNPSSVPHNFYVEDESGEVVGETDLITQSSASTTVDLQPGTYTYFCDVPGHRESGMEGTLTVK